MTDYAAVLIYKLTILPHIECAGFLVVGCTLEERRDLQKCQNDALRICNKQRLMDHVPVEELHAKCNIISLEQRKRNKLLVLMYKKSCDVSLHKVFPRYTRRSIRIVFETANYQGKTLTKLK